MLNLVKKILIIICLFLHSNLFSQDLRGTIDSVNTLSYNQIVSDLNKSTSIFNDNLKKARSIAYQRGEGLALSNLALVYYLKGNYDKSTQYHIESFKIFSDNKMYKELSDAYGEYGYQLKRRDLKKAVAYMRMAIKTSDDHGIPIVLKGKLFDNYGVLKEMQSEADSAIYFYKKALEIKINSHDSLGIPFSLNKIAVLKAAQGKMNEAYKYLNLSDSYRQRESGSFGRMENMAFHADFYRLENKLDESIAAYEKAKQMAIDINYTYMILYCYENLTELYKKKKQFEKALLNHENYLIYKDSIDNIEENTKVAQLEIAYETEQKNKIIAQNKYEINAKTQQLTFTLITLVLLLLIIVGVYNYQHQKRIRAISDLEFTSKLTQANLEKKLSEEKLKISRELHDNIGSQLTFIISSLDNISYINKSNKLLPKLDAIKDFSKDALSDLRSTIWAMKQKEGSIDSFVIKLNEMINRLNASLNELKIELENQTSSNYVLNSFQMLNLYRVVQEALQNSIKYSNASKIKIIFRSIDDGIELLISDNGNGFDLSEVRPGNGINNMNARCNQAGGTFEINSSDTGTIIKCKIGLT